MKKEFRTQTGQTGMDAYLFEAAAIANSQRDLDARFKRLLQVVHEEAPEVFADSTDFHPEFARAGRAKSFLAYLMKRR
jgi:hypothetical protein